MTDKPVKSPSKPNILQQVTIRPKSKGKTDKREETDRLRSALVEAID